MRSKRLVSRLSGTSLLVLVSLLALGSFGGTVAMAKAKKPKPLPTGNPTSPITLTEAGSTLLYPYLEVLAPQVTATYPNLTLAPSAGGSGLGIADAIGKLTSFGGSDAYLSPADALANPSLMNIPIAISAQAVDYNVPGAPSYLRFSGNVLAQIYQGKITNWDAPQLASLNPGVTLPNLAIVPVRRVDSSGDTFIFTSFLTATDKAWANGPSEGTTVTWPAVSNELTAQGNPGMITVCKGTPGCIAYIGVSVEDTAIEDGLKEGLLENRSRKFVRPVLSTITAAVTAAAGSTPADLTQSLIYSKGKQSYPIVNFEYLIVQKHQKSKAVAEAIRTFYSWAISPSGGSTPDNLAAVDFVALPKVVIPKVNAALQKITG
ncbi:MAG TPA: phosphate ABC transporter substrate-binding protein PstS [Candidatus Saccharimonadales bacterium]|nr:phosphate ABC transporter substrate-binding protein PstS [Candidatus Saccharimonadales bacterium]